MASIRQWTIEDMLQGAQQLNQQLAVQLGQVRTEMQTRDEAHLRSVIDALDNVAMAAINGHEPSQRILARWREVMGKIEQAPANSGLVVARGFRANGSKPG